MNKEIVVEKESDYESEDCQCIELPCINYDCTCKYCHGEWDV